MTRELQLVQTPQFHPHTCVRCGCGTGEREFFIDLGLDLAGVFNPLYDGNVYYCNLCARNLVSDIHRAVGKWDADHAPWDSEDRVNNTYDWESSISIAPPVEAQDDGIREDGDGVTSSSADAESNDRTTESSESDAAESITVSESAVPSTSSDDEQSGNAGGITLDFGGPSL